MLVAGFYTKQCGQLWPRGFNTEGGIQQKRLVSGGCVIGYFRGIPWIVVWRAGHIMSGDKQFAYFQTATTPGQGDWHFGSAVASADMLDDTHVVEVEPKVSLPSQTPPMW
jgi:hypothetical protein